VTPDYVSRDGLTARLDSGSELPLSVISAPAGYGKSTLVSSWVSSLDSASAWLSLDDTDNDPRTFVNYLAAALHASIDNICNKTLDVINAEMIPELPVVSAQLLNDLSALDKRIILVLDDYQRINTPEIHSLIESLLSHPPLYLHLVVLSRRDPPLSLASLRAGHLVNEIRMSDLEFSAEETQVFFSQAIGRHVDKGVISKLQDVTEGWPVGIRLAALAARNQVDAEGYLRHFGSDVRPLREYLVSEVLSSQPTALRNYMLGASMLERFNAALCDAVCSNDICHTGAPISGKEFIEFLEKSGLFCISLDVKGEWFRFHHLFGNLLHQQLVEKFSSEKVQELHLSASRWFAENGYFEEAIKHALAGEDEIKAAVIVGRARHQLMLSDQWGRLEIWLNLFSDRMIQRHPQLMILKCWLDLSHWYRLYDLPSDLDQTDELLGSSNSEDSETPQLTAELSVIRSSLAYWSVNPDLVAELTESALADIPLEQEYVHSVALMYRAGGYQLHGKSRKAVSFLSQYGEQSQLSSPGVQALILQATCFIYWGAAEARKLWKAASRLLEISLENELLWSISFARYFLGIVHYERNELEDAIAQFDEIVAEPYRHTIQNVTHCSFMLSLSYQALGDNRKARDVVESITKLTFERRNRMFIDLAEAYQAELDLRQGQLSRASKWADAYDFPPPHAMHRFYIAELTYIKVLIARNTPASLAIAAGQLKILHGLLESTSQHRLLIDILALEAVIVHAEGDNESALKLLKQAVVVAQPERLVRPFADTGFELTSMLKDLEMDKEGEKFVAMIVSSLRTMEPTAELPPANQGLAEPLSVREIEILNLLAQKLSNKEIAARLFISPGTVKRHAHNIYAKLSVDGRRQAVSSARDLGLLKTS
jgi:LuxR family maltose regulon positive regulatory protein